jgi:hypothetical protein
MKIKLSKERKRTITIAGVIVSLMRCFRDDEKTRLHKKIEIDIKKSFGRLVSIYGREEMLSIGSENSVLVWGKAMVKYPDEGLLFEASSMVLHLWNLDEKNLAKQFLLSKGKVGRWATPSSRVGHLDAELNSREIAKFVMEKINELYDIEEEKKLSVLERIELTKINKRKDKS